MLDFQIREVKIKGDRLGLRHGTENENGVLLPRPWSATLLFTQESQLRINYKTAQNLGLRVLDVLLRRASELIR
jgi:hypothetical protein